MRRHLLVISSLLLAPSACLFAPSNTNAANWQITRVNHTLLTPPGGVTVAEMSGVTYLGPAAGANHRFLAAEEIKGELVQFDLTFNAAGGISAVSNVAAVDIVPTLDFEGIAYTNAVRNSVFISDENGPGVRELNLATGAELQSVAIPPVFANRRANLGFESLARSPDGAVMWAANEQALTVDGPVATSSAGTNVRLLKLNVAGDAVAAGSQFAYRVEPIHGTNTFGSPQSGLSDLVAMPDGTVIALERSVSLLASPSTYLNRIYEIDFAGATDVSVGPTAAGLTGQTFTPSLSSCFGPARPTARTARISKASPSDRAWRTAVGCSSEWSTMVMSSVTTLSSPSPPRPSRPPTSTPTATSTPTISRSGRRTSQRPSRPSQRPFQNPQPRSTRSAV